MKRSSNRILTTHIGSLARPNDLMQTMDARLKGEPVDEQVYQRREVQEVFMPAIPAGFFVHPSGGTGNTYYKTQEEYLYALGEALREEYLAITEAGFVLQIDDPSLTRLYHSNPDAPLEERQKASEA